MRKIVLLSVLVFFWGCKEGQPGPAKNSRLKYSVFIYEDRNEIIHYWSNYTYDKNGLLISRILNDTTYSLYSNQYLPAKSVTDYKYDKDGFLIERTVSLESIILVSKNVTTYTYFNGLLIREKDSSREIVYNYDAAGLLINTVSTSLNSGSKTITNYKDNVLEGWEADGSGYVSKTPTVIQYYDKKLLLKKTERYSGNVLNYQEDWSYADVKHPNATVREWKGFPKIKSLDYRAGIEKNIRKYSIANGVETTIEEKTLAQSYDEKGLLTNSKGMEKLRMNTSDPFVRTIELRYFYEDY